MPVHEEDECIHPKLRNNQPDWRVVPTIYGACTDRDDTQNYVHIDLWARPETGSRVQALKARGEPLLSGFETTQEGINAQFAPLQWQLTELLSPK